MLDHELLLAISELFDTKLEAKMEPIRNDIRDIKLDIEHDIKPQLRLLAENYVPAAKRYESESAKVSVLEADMELVKKVVAEHSEKLRQLA